MLKRAASIILAAGLALATACTALPAQAAGKTYTSELTGEPISTSIKNQRPIAVMIDNDKRAYPHYGLADADIVYELINSTANSRVTRLMAVYKDWNNVSMIGNIRSTRPTNIMTAAEYNAVLVHDGGPYHNKAYFKSTGIDHLTGGFARVKNGKAVEFTEYVKSRQVSSRLKSAGISSSYTENVGNHFNFAPYGTEVDLKDEYGSGAVSCTSVSLPYAHNKSALKYNSKTKTYDYYEFGKVCVDALNKKAPSFKNVIIQEVDMVQLDKNGYMLFNCQGQGIGYYITDGKMIPITWIKPTQTSKTSYYDGAGKEIEVNCGKTYITMCPTDSWSKLKTE